MFQECKCLIHILGPCLINFPLQFHVFRYQYLNFVQRLQSIQFLHRSSYLALYRLKAFYSTLPLDLIDPLSDQMSLLLYRKHSNRSLYEYLVICTLDFQLGEQFLQAYFSFGSKNQFSLFFSCHYENVPALVLLDLSFEIKYILMLFIHCIVV